MHSLECTRSSLPATRAAHDVPTLQVATMLIHFSVKVLSFISQHYERISAIATFSKSEILFSNEAMYLDNEHGNHPCHELLVLL